MGSLQAALSARADVARASCDRSANRDGDRVANRRRGGQGSSCFTALPGVISTSGPAIGRRLARAVPPGGPPNDHRAAAAALTLAPASFRSARLGGVSVPTSVSWSSPRMNASTRLNAMSSWIWIGGLFMK